MSEATDTLARSASNEDTRKNPHGDFIWYELITPDPDGAKAFYDAVVGWDIEAKPSGEMDYRMIGAADGLAGGVMRLTDEMQSHGARPTWLGYIGVDDVDASVASIEQAGGKALMPAFDIPKVGRIALVTDPQGAPFYVMRAIPPEGRENVQSDVFSADAAQRIGWNELSTSDQVAACKFYGEQFGWSSDDFMPMGEMGEYRFLDHHGVRLGAVYHPSNEGVAAKQDQQPKWRYYIRIASITDAEAAIKAGGGTIAMGPHEVPTGDMIIIGTDPQGAEFAVVGKQGE